MNNNDNSKNNSGIKIYSSNIMNDKNVNNSFNNDDNIIINDNKKTKLGKLNNSIDISDKNSDNYNNNITENEKTENNNNNIYINENIDKNKDNNSNNNIEYNDLFNTNENKESNLINYNTLSKDDYVTEKSTSTQSPNPSKFLGKKDNKGLKTGFGIE